MTLWHHAFLKLDSIQAHSSGNRIPAGCFKQMPCCNSLYHSVPTAPNHDLLDNPLFLPCPPRSAVEHQHVFPFPDFRWKVFDIIFWSEHGYRNGFAHLWNKGSWRLQPLKGKLLFLWVKEGDRRLRLLHCFLPCKELALHVSWRNRENKQLLFGLAVFLAEGNF